MEEQSILIVFGILSIFVYFQGLLEGTPCTTSPPDTLAALLWTIIAVFGIVYTLLGMLTIKTH